MRMAASRMEIAEAAASRTKIANLFLCCSISFRSIKISFELYLSQAAQHAFGRKRELVQPHAGCVMDGGGYGRCDWQEGQVAQPARAPRPALIRDFQQHRLDPVRDIPYGLDQVGTKLVGQHLAVARDEVFQHGV